MIKKIILIPLILFSYVLFDCGKKSDKINIEFWTLQLSPVFNDYFNGLISEYEVLHPNVKIKWVDIPYDAVIQKLLASFTAGNAPDVVNLSADFLSKFNKLGTLLDLAPFLTDSIKNLYITNALNGNIFENKLVGLPWYLNTYTLIYNKELLEKGGFNEKQLPKTFDELINFSKIYKDKTNKYAIFCNLGKDSFLPMILESEGIHLTNSEMTKSTFNSDECINIIEKWVNLYKSGYLQSESLIKPGSSLIEAYQSGQVAMVFTGPVFLKRIHENAPGIYKVTDIAPAIVGKTGNHELAIMSVSVTSTTKYKKESVEFAEFITNDKNQLEFSHLATIYPSRKNSLEDTFFTKSDSTLETKARIIGAKQIESAIKLSKYLNHPKFDQLKTIFEEEIQAACLGKISAREAVTNASQKWDKILVLK